MRDLFGRARRRTLIRGQCFNIGQVLFASRRPLVLLQVFQINEVYLNAINPNHCAREIAIREIDTVRRAYEVDAVRGVAELDGPVWRQEIRPGDVKGAKTEVVEHRHQPLRVRFAHFKPDVNVLGIPGVTVRSHRVAADHEILNALCV